MKLLQCERQKITGIGDTLNQQTIGNRQLATLLAIPHLFAINLDPRSKKVKEQIGPDSRQHVQPKQPSTVN